MRSSLFCFGSAIKLYQALKLEGQGLPTNEEI